MCYSLISDNSAEFVAANKGRTISEMTVELL